MNKLKSGIKTNKKKTSIFLRFLINIDFDNFKSKKYIPGYLYK